MEKDSKQQATQAADAPEVQAILRRLQAVAHLSVNGGGDNVGGKYYGTPVEVGASTVTFWHCEKYDTDKVLPSHLTLSEGCGDKDVMTLEDFFGDCYPCSSHWQSEGDYDMAEFLVNARQDIALLLSLLGVDAPEIKEREW